MSLTIKTKISGDKEVARKIEELAKKNIAALKDVMTKSVLVVEAKAKINVPVLTGRLRSSITTEVIKAKKGYDGKIGTNVKYAPYVEFGTSRMSARPYLFPAMKNSRADIIGFLTSAIKGVR